MVIAFADLLESLSAAPVILRHKPSAVEVMDKSILDNTRQNARARPDSQLRSSKAIRRPRCASNSTPTARKICRRACARSKKICARGISATTTATKPTRAKQARIWSLREAALGLSMAMKGDAKSISFVEDTAVAPERLSEYIGRFLELLRTPWNHRGNLRARFGRLPARAAGGQSEDRGRACASSKPSRTRWRIWCWNSAARFPASTAMAWCAARSCGRCSATTLYEAFREIKRTFDPLGILNPGKIVDAPPLTSNLRFGASYQTPRQSADLVRLFANTAEWAARSKCAAASARAARSLSGTMCPSYMATRDEAHSTRGRANVLRLAMTGQLGESGLGDEGVYEVLDLCLECRACKSECPVGVDMAAFKSEFLADYWKPPRHAVAAKALGNIH